MATVFSTILEVTLLTFPVGSFIGMLILTDNSRNFNLNDSNIMARQHGGNLADGVYPTVFFLWVFSIFILKASFEIKKTTVGTKCGALFWFFVVYIFLIATFPSNFGSFGSVPGIFCTSTIVIHMTIVGIWLNKLEADMKYCTSNAQVVSVLQETTTV